MAVITRYVNTDNSVSGDGTTNETDGSPDSAYTSLSASLAAEKTDLVAAQNSLVILCEGSTLDTTGTELTTGVWVTTNDYNVTIKPNVGQEHNGVWDDSKYRIQLLHFDSGSIGSFVVDGLQIKELNSLATVRLVGGAFSGSVGIQVIKNCLISGGRSTVGSLGTCVYITRNGPQIFLYNNMIYVSASSQHNPATSQKAVYSDGSNNLKFYNNTVVGDWVYGFDVGGPNHLKNNIFSGMLSSSYFGTPTTDEYNATYDGDASGTGARTNQTFSFINPSANDYRLSSKDKGGVRFGVDVSGDTLLTDYTQSLTTDIVGTTRTTPWDIGAYQLPYDETEGRVVPKPPPSTPSYVTGSDKTRGTEEQDDLTFNVGSGINRKAIIFFTNQNGSGPPAPFPYTCSYDPDGVNIRTTKLDSLDANNISLFDSYYNTSVFYYDIPDNDSGDKVLRFNTDNTLRGAAQVVVYENCVSGAPYTSSLEIYNTASNSPAIFSYASSSLTLEGLSRVVSYALLEDDSAGGPSLTASNIETERSNISYGDNLGGDVIVGDFTSSLTSVVTEYTSSKLGHVSTCIALAIKSPLPRGSSIQSDTQWFYDDFNRPNQSITASSDWDENTLYTNDNGVNWFINDGTLGPNGNSQLNGFAFLNTASYQWTNDQLSEVVYSNINTFDYAGPAVRLNFGPGHESGSGYVLFHDGFVDSGRRIRRMDNGSLASGGSDGNFSIAAGDKVRLEAVGTTISCYVNGNLAVSWTESTYESGSVGVFYKKENTATTKFDSFYAQNIVSGQTGKPFKIS